MKDRCFNPFWQALLCSPLRPLEEAAKTGHGFGVLWFSGNSCNHQPNSPLCAGLGSRAIKLGTDCSGAEAMNCPELDSGIFRLQQHQNDSKRPLLSCFSGTMVCAEGHLQRASRNPRHLALEEACFHSPVCWPPERTDDTRF